MVMSYLQELNLLSCLLIKMQNFYNEPLILISLI